MAQAIRLSSAPSPPCPPAPEKLKRRHDVRRAGKDESDGTEVGQGRLLYSDALLRDLSKGLSGCWRVLGGRLKVTTARMDALVERNVKTPEELCTAMLKAWWGETPHRHRWGELGRVFTCIKRVELFAQWMTLLHRNGLDFENPDSRAIDKHLGTLGRRLASRWKEVGGYLKMSPERLHRVAEECECGGSPAEWAFQVLKMWQADSAGSAPFELLRVLTEDMEKYHLGITILLDFIKQET